MLGASRAKTVHRDNIAISDLLLFLVLEGEECRRASVTLENDVHYLASWQRASLKIIGSTLMELFRDIMAVGVGFYFSPRLPHHLAHFSNVFTQKLNFSSTSIQVRASLPMLFAP